MQAEPQTVVETDLEDQLIPESHIQRWAIWVAAVLLLIALTAYLANFKGGLSDQTSVWGEFGDYLGGLVNPIVGFLTICLLTVSLRQNQLALQQARAELRLARKAIEQAKEVQQKTESALKAQIEIAMQARDMNNAIALFNVLSERRDLANKRLNYLRNSKSDCGEELAKLKDDLSRFNKSRADMADIMNNEIERLKSIHLIDAQEG